jgi:thymidylate synthase
MKQYLDIVRDVIDNGLWKENRTGIKTLALPGVFFEHNMEDGFPLLTVRRMPIKSIAVEVEGFLKGITSKKWYQERGCKFWDNWSNPKVAKEEYDIAQGQAASDEVMGLLSYEPTIQEIQKKVDDAGRRVYQKSIDGEKYGEPRALLTHAEYVAAVKAAARISPSLGVQRWTGPYYRG